MLCVYTWCVGVDGYVLGVGVMRVGVSGHERLCGGRCHAYSAQGKGAQSGVRGDGWGDRRWMVEADGLWVKTQLARDAVRAIEGPCSDKGEP